MTDRDKDAVIQIKMLNVELRKKLEAVSKLRVECAELQLKILKLYSPETLEIVESLEQLITRETENVISGETIEMQENVLDYPYPIHSGPNIITSQPYGQVQESRRETYQNSLDWISTPRPQLSILSGTNFLGNVEQLVIQQVVDLSTLLGRTERRLQYRVKIPRGETLFLAMLVDTEVGLSTPLLCSELIPRCGDFDLNVVDQFGQPAFKMKISSRWTCPLSKLRKITVGNANLIGTVEQNFTIIGPSFTVYDDARNELCNVIGPNICGCCMYKEAHFQVITNDGTHQIASLMHQWDNTLRDYVLLISFPEATDIKLKSLILATAFLLLLIRDQKDELDYGAWHRTAERGGGVREKNLWKDSLALIPNAPSVLFPHHLYICISSR